MEQNNQHKENQSNNQVDPKSVPMLQDANQSNKPENIKNSMTNNPKDDAPKKTCYTMNNVVAISQLLVALATIGTLCVVYSQTKILNEQLLQQSRAWVTVKGANLMQFKEGQPIIAHVTFTNSGNGIALNATIHNNIQLRDSIVPSPIILNPSNNEPSKGIIGPKGEFDSIITTKGILTAENIKDITSRKRRLYVWGRIEYDDIFKQHRITDFCLVNKLGSLNFAACANNNHAT